MLFRNASQAILWYSLVALPSISASFCICASLNGGMYTPPVLPVTVAGWSTSTLTLGFGAGLATAAGVFAAAAAAAGAAAAGAAPPLPLSPPLLPPRESFPAASFSRSLPPFPLSRPRSSRSLLLLLLLLRRLRFESRRVLALSSLLLLLLLLRLLRPPVLPRFPDRSSRPFSGAADPDLFDCLGSSFDLFPSGARERFGSSEVALPLPLLPLLLPPPLVSERRGGGEPSSDEEPEEEDPEEDDDEEEDDDDADLPRFLLLSDILH